MNNCGNEMIFRISRLYTGSTSGLLIRLAKTPSKPELNCSSWDIQVPTELQKRLGQARSSRAARRLEEETLIWRRSARGIDAKQR